MTRREREIVNLLAQGKRQTDIARELCISIDTVYAHAKNARCKTGTSSTFELAIKAAIQKDTD